MKINRRIIYGVFINLLVCTVFLSFVGCAIETGKASVTPTNQEARYSHPKEERTSPIEDFEIVHGVLTAYYGNDADVFIPDGVEYVDLGLFSESQALKNIHIPASVIYISQERPVSLYMLKSISVDENNTKYISVDGVLFDKDMKTLIVYPAAKAAATYVIPDGVTTIGDFSFEFSKSLESINMPDSLKTIGFSAFYDCGSLKSITISKGLEEIANCPFLGCYSLENIFTDTSNPNFTNVDGVLFSKDMKTLIAFPAGKAATSYAIPDGITAIRGTAFANCASLESLTIPDSVIKIGTGAFYCCELLREMKIPKRIILEYEDQPFSIHDYFD